MTRTPLARAVEAFKALSHPGRLRIVEMLASGPLAECQITAVIGGAPSTISAHLSELSYAGILEHERRGRFVVFRLAEGDPDGLLAEVRALVRADDQVRVDAAHANRLRARGVEAIDSGESCPCAEPGLGEENAEPVRAGKRR